MRNITVNGQNFQLLPLRQVTVKGQQFEMRSLDGRSWFSRPSTLLKFVRSARREGDEASTPPDVRSPRKRSGEAAKAAARSRAKRGSAV